VTAQTEQLSENAAAWKAGYAAGMRALARGANPYSLGCDNAQACAAGTSRAPRSCGNQRKSEDCTDAPRRHLSQVPAEVGGTLTHVRVDTANDT
jgi:hypothetical protein